ncbi:SdrD B-like domain-containing protein [Polaromonas sp.]|uniref:SdrD B-like domain-containing protein n=1 Tax=Polaromonas sp. TaxID=1869339 RepID=UPI0025F13F6C|nr:SdrD B-like domain-containing protein [Polaromonas sp.]
MLFRLFRKLLPFCLLLVLLTVAKAGPAPAGTVISNTGTGTYVDSASGLSVRLKSNTVNTTITVLEALTLSANQTVLVANGSSFAISHKLTNTGNALATYRITASVAVGGAFTPLGVQVIQDTNSNGRADTGEPVISAGGAISLTPGDSVNLLLTAQAPATSTPGQSAQLVVAALSTLQGVSASNTDTITLTNGAAIVATLAPSAATALPEASLGFTATVVNNGNAAAASTVVTLNGAPATLFVLRVPVPVNVTFVSIQMPVSPGTQVLYHVLGSAVDSYVTSLPVGAVVDVVAWGVASLPQGASLQGQFTVTVNNNAAGTITGTAYTDWTDQGARLSTGSNTVVLPLPARAAKIAFYTNTSYLTPAIQNLTGSPLFIQVDAAACNTSPTQINTAPVTLVSQLTGDTETFTAVETGANTGLFRILPNVPTANAAFRVVASGNGILEVLRDDVVSATLTACGGISVSATTTLLIDPSGVVYDSKTNQPLAGVTVQLIDVTGAGNGGKPGSAATVFLPDGTPAPSQIITLADGSFAFPLVAPSTYKLMLGTPAGYTFPSKLPAALQPAGRLIDAQGSYGKEFTIASTDRAPVRFDVPLDAGATGGLFIQKTANKATAEIGDFVDYSVKFNNVTAVRLPATVVNDSLPAGFAYVRGTARLNGAPLPDPAGRTGPGLQFSLGSVAVGAQPVLTYRVRVGAGSQGSNGVNTAQAVSGNVLSNNSSVRVQLVGGVFSNKAYLIGKVFADCRQNGIQDAGEPGIPGVRLYLEDGTHAITDEEGKYSLYGLTPRTHVVKIDRTTLPAGATLEVLSNRNALDPDSRFVDLTHGELQKADFAVAECTPDVQEQVAARRKALSSPNEVLQAAALLLSSTTSAAAADGRALPSSGTFGLPGALQANGGSNTTKLLPTTTFPGVTLRPSSSAAALGAVGDPGGPYAPTAQGVPQALFTPGKMQPDAVPSTNILASPPEPGEQSQPMQPLEDLLPGLGPEVGFINLRNEQVLTSDQTRVRVKGPVGGNFELLVNGQPVPLTQVGKKSSLEENGTLAWEYIGINLKPGRNTLILRSTDPFGNLRGQEQITLLAPGALAHIGIDVSAHPVADSATPLAVTLRLRDAQNLPVAVRTQVTLLSSLGQWQTPDLDPQQPGVQVFVEGGEARFLLLPPAQPGKAELSATSGKVNAVAKVEFLPNLRPMLAVGLIEGTINLRNLSPSGLQPTQSGDVFERQIQSASRSFDNGKGEVAARAALFLKGKVLGSTLLTLAYDSDKPSDTALFRDIQPNQFYPVYGDSSARGFDAQSTGKLYVMVQNGTSYALLGDYSTQSDNPVRQLTQYSRALNGVKGRLQEGNFTVEGFASRTSTTQLVEEFRANGTSGPFRLNVNGVVNSQQVNILTRDRNQPSVIVKDVPLAAFTDYELEPYSGQLLLKSPVPSVDADLNPVFIRVSYAIDSGGPKHSVAGADVRVQLTPNLAVGATLIRDADPVNQQSLAGINMAARLGDKTLATAEIARSSTDLQGSGGGQRIEIRHDDLALQARVWAARTDAGFFNPNSPQSAGRSEYGVKTGIPLDEKNRLVAEALKTSDSITGAEQTGAEIKLEHSLPGNARIEAGFRYSRANASSVLTAFPLPGTSLPVSPGAAALAAASAQTGFTSARVKLTVPVPNLPQADVFGIAEYAIDGSGGRQIGLGGNYAVNPTTKLYLRHDLTNSLNGPYNLNPAVSQYTTVAGINTELPDSTQVFNEYRMGDSLNGRNSEAAVGLRRLWRLESGLGLTGSLQRIKPLTGVVADDSSAVTLGIDYVAAADWKGSAQVQWQTSSASRSWLTSAALANKLDADWTLLNRALYSMQTSLAAAGGERKLVTAQSGFSYRPVETDAFNALGRIQFKRDLDSTLGAGLNRDESSWLASTHVNFQPSHHWLMTGRYAARWATDRANTLDSRSFTQLLGGRSTWDVTDRVDIGVQAYRMWGNGAAETAMGVEAGYLVWKNLWLSLGYNAKGFRAAELAGDAYTQRGVYLRLRFKFDENLFGADAATSGMPVASTSPAKAALVSADSQP